MTRHLRRSRLVLAFAAVLGLPAAADAAPMIVDLAPGSDPAAVAAAAGVTPEVVFDESGEGFAADLTNAQATKLRRAAAVTAVRSDGIVARLAARPAPPEQSAQVVRVAQRRVGLLASPTADVDGVDDRRIDVDIAVFDGGIDPGHPELDVVGGADCTVGKGWKDRDGHGTMVAGIAAAIDNDAGMAGIAPGARLWAIRVADPDGFISDSALRCGLEWLVRHAKKIEVANWSFGEGEPGSGACGTRGSTIFDVQHRLTCLAVARGVTIVGAAGNESEDAGRWAPAAWPQVIAVSATTETDGLPGGLGPNSVCWPDERDDTFAFFSDFGSAVDIAAPGVCITSTFPGGGYAFSDGTSFATPFVAGAAALVMARNPSATPAQVRQILLARAEPGPLAGDPDAVPEPFLNVAGL